MIFLPIAPTRLRHVAPLLVFLSLWAGAARGDDASSNVVRRWTVPSTHEQSALLVEVRGHEVFASACATEPCAASPRPSLVVPASARIRQLTFTPRRLASGERLAHLRLPLEEGVWEAILAAERGAPRVKVVFSGTTGRVHGEDGDRRGTELWWREGTAGVRLLRGQRRDDLDLCGRPALLSPKLLVGDDLEFRPAKVQQLSLEERRRAPRLSAKRSPAPTSLSANPLRALAATSALGAPGALTDGRPDTAWSEARGGGGRGEFAFFRAPSQVPLVAVQLQVRPSSSRPEGAAPKNLWLAFRDRLYLVTWDHDAWREPGAWYRVDLPEPVRSDCLAVVLERTPSADPGAQVTLAEVRGVSALETLALDELVTRLSAPGDSGDAAARTLAYAGTRGAQALFARLSSLSTRGRRRALDALSELDCEAALPSYVKLLDDAASRARAARRLRACRPASLSALRARFESAPPAALLRVPRSLVEVDAGLAVELLLGGLPRATPQERRALSEVLVRASRRAEAQVAVGNGLVDATRPLEVRALLLRSLGDDFSRVLPQAVEAWWSVAPGATSFRQRYLLLPVAARLAEVDATALQFLVRSATDSDPHLSAAAVARLPADPVTQPVLHAALVDRDVMVRHAAARRLGELPLKASGVASLTEILAADSWPLVRAAAARSLGSAPRAFSVARTLAVAVEDDPSERVRRRAVTALGQRVAVGDPEAPGNVRLLVDRFRDPEEHPRVRAAAARALGVACDGSQLAEMTRAARSLAGRASPAELIVGRASLAALGRLAPSDLELRIEPLLGVDHERHLPPSVRRAVARALRPAARCASLRSFVRASRRDRTRWTPGKPKSLRDQRPRRASDHER